MANINLFSRRQRELRGEVPDVYTYDTISHPLKVQVVHIWVDALGNEHDYSQHSARHATTFKAYRVIVETLCREFGVLALPSVAESTYIRNYRTHGRRFITELYSFFLENDNTEQLLDTIELSFRYI